MSNKSSNNKQIAKNAAALYFRMIITMLVGLYTSRVILQALGVEDYGIYNVAGLTCMCLSVSEIRIMPAAPMQQAFGVSGCDSGYCGSREI